MVSPYSNSTSICIVPGNKEHVDGQHNLVNCFFHYIDADSIRERRLYSYNWDIFIINENIYGNILRKIGCKYRENVSFY